MKPSKICCDRLDAHLVASKFSTICSGGRGEQPPYRCPVENLLRFAESSFSNVEVFEDCSGGNSRLSYLLGCGGRYFFDQEVLFVGLFVVCAVSVIPKGTCCPPLTSFSGIKSSRGINFSLVRLRLLIPDSAAGAFFLFFGVFTLALLISASMPSLQRQGQKRRWSLRLLLNPRHLCSQLFL